MMKERLTVISLVCLMLLASAVLQSASAAVMLSIESMDEVHGGCPSYCLSIMECGGPVKGCTSAMFGANRCDPNAEPDDCSGGPQNECQATTVHSACNSVHSSNPICAKGTKVYCGQAYHCHCTMLTYGNYICQRIDDIPDGTCGYYNPATPGC